MVLGRHSFAFRVIEPVDDAFWVGVAYADVWVGENPKQNLRSIVWAGGNIKANRPGTVRVNSEKMRNQPQYVPLHSIFVPCSMVQFLKLEFGFVRILVLCFIVHIL